MKFFKYLFIFVSAFTVLSVYLLNLPAIGRPPSSEDSHQFKDSLNFDSKIKQFLNRRPLILEEMRGNGFSLELYKEWFLGSEKRTPSEKLPEKKPNMQKFVSPSKKIKLIWLGHSTLLLNLNGTIVLIDPVFSSAASPFSFIVKRFQEPVLKLEQLPKIDFVVISHDHYDHLDMQSVTFFKNKETTFLVPLGVGSHLKGWGISDKKITELDWWDSQSFGKTEFIATPAQHFSGRSLFDSNKTLWASWVIKQEPHKIYFSGDSGYDSHYKEIGKRHGPFDIAFIENGQYNFRWRAVHLMPEESAQAYFDLKAKTFFPIHWGMFELSFHNWFDPIVAISRLSQQQNIDLIAPQLGELVFVDDSNKHIKWWDALVDPRPVAQ